MANLIQGSRAANQLSARGANDTVEGLAGNDILSSGTTALTDVYLFGGDGNDTLIAKASDLLIDGGAGTDTVRFAAAVASLADPVLESVENVVLTSTEAAVYNFGSQSESLNITGTRVVDSITGGAGNDTITGGLGADQLVGGLGDDVLVAEATDALIDGTSGNDTVRFAAAVSGLTDARLVNIDNIVITNTSAAAYDFSWQGVAGTENLNITGGRANDTITGGADADTLSGGNGNDVLIAEAADALVDGGAGNDTVKYAAAVAGLDDAELANVEYVVITAAGGSFDFSNQTEGLDITGTGSDDSIYGGSGADALRGGLGIDHLYAGDNDKLIDGGNGADTAVFAASVSAKNLLDADLINVENISITGTGAYDFSAQSEKLVITAAGLLAAAAVTITGGKGVDTLTGGAGDDVIVASDLDVINGTSGNDTVRFAAAVSAANLGDDDLTNIDNIVITNTKAATYDFSAQAGEAFNITGSSGNDTIKTATITSDTISGGAGNDVLVVEDIDVIDGGTGTDTVYFGAAVTTAGLADADLVNVENVLLTAVTMNADFSVQTESLQISGSSGVNSIKGGLRADTIIGGDGADSLYGNGGADILIADTSDMLIDGGDGTDTVRFAAAVTNLLGDTKLLNVENVVITNTGNAAYYFGDQIEALNITGNSGADTLTGGLAADTLSGGAGNDVLVATATDALIDGGAGTDTVRFAAAVTTANLANADLVNVERVEITNTSAAAYDFGVQTEALTIVGNINNDVVTGGTGNDSISGEAGIDNLSGGAGADTLVGGADNDVLTGDDGVDSLLGGDGDDTLNAQDIDARIDGGSGTGDTAQFAAGVTAINLTDAKLVGIENVTITNTAAASYDFSAQTEALVITGGAAADTITGTQDWDTFVVADNTKVLTGESYNGGAGTDTLSVTDTSADLTGLTGLTSVEVITLADGVAAIFAASALTGDTIAVKGVNGGSVETLTVNGTDTAGDTIDLSGLTLTDIATVTINGLAENDVITGTSSGDTIDGGAGADTLSGGAGADSLLGGTGADVFLVAAAGDHAAGEVITGGDGADVDVIRFTSTTAQTLTLTSTVTTVEEARIAAADGTATGTTNENINAAAAVGTIALYGNAGNNALTGNASDNVIVGGGGVDALVGGDGNDTFVYATMAEFVTGSAVVDTVTGGNGTADKIQVNAAISIVTGDSLARVGTVEQLVAETQASAGRTHSIVQNDDAKLGTIRTIDLSGDTNAGSTGVINLTGITSAITNTTLKGVGAGQNTITGGAGVDSITGGSVADVINGGDGADVITGGAGADALTGGAGADVFIVASATDGGVGEVYDGGGESDTIRVTGTTALDLSNDTLTSIEMLDLNTDADDQTVVLNVAQAKAITTISADSASDAINLNDAAGTAILATDLSTIGATTATVTATNAIAISGTVVEATAALVTAASAVTAATATVTLNDAASSTLTATALAAVGDATSGTVTVANSQTITGTGAEVTAALVTAATKVVMATGKVATVDLTAATTFTAAELTSVYGAVGGPVVGTGADTITVSTLNAATVAATESVDTFQFATSDTGVSITDFTVGNSGDVLKFTAFVSITGVLEGAGATATGTLEKTTAGAVTTGTDIAGKALIWGGTIAEFQTALVTATATDKLYLANADEAVVLVGDPVNGAQTYNAYYVTGTGTDGETVTLVGTVAVNDGDALTGFNLTGV